jgi:hypothetical protein
VKLAEDTIPAYSVKDSEPACPRSSSSEGAS